MAQGDLAVLRHLAELDFLLSDRYRATRRRSTKARPIFRLGARIGRLHRLEVPHDADRPAGALHHVAEGTMTDELRATARWLDAIGMHAPGLPSDAIAHLRAALDDADGGDGLPEAFVHPDPVPKNATFTSDAPGRTALPGGWASR